MSRRGDDAATPRDRLRAEFDASFALPPHGAEVDLVEFIVVRVGTETYAMRASSIDALGTRPRIEPVPSRDTSFLGLVTDRGRLVPAFSLATMLGGAARATSPSSTEPATTRWLVFVGREERAAFEFDRFVGHVRASTDTIAASSRATARAVVEVVRTPEATIPVIDPAVLMAMLRERIA